MTQPTISERLFEKLCDERGISWDRIPEQGITTADYRVILSCGPIVVEIKQLDLNEADQHLDQNWSEGEVVMGGPPVKRVQGVLSTGYKQIKISTEGKLPGIILLYNNAGPLNRIDAFTVSRAMYGEFAIGFSIIESKVQQTSAGYKGRRKVTQETMRALSAVLVLNERQTEMSYATAYHNPFAACPIAPGILAEIAESQFLHPDPHGTKIIQWEPQKLET